MIKRHKERRADLLAREVSEMTPKTYLGAQKRIR